MYIVNVRQSIHIYNEIRFYDSILMHDTQLWKKNTCNALHYSSHLISFKELGYAELPHSTCNLIAFPSTHWLCEQIKGSPHDLVIPRSLKMVWHHLKFMKVAHKLVTFMFWPSTDQLSIFSRCTLFHVSFTEIIIEGF